VGAMKVWDGSTWQTVAPFSEHASCYVGPDAPVGTAYAGDLWWDTDEPAIAYPGAELAYNQVTTAVTVTSNAPATANLIIEGTTRTYDGSPVLVTFNCHVVSTTTNNAAQLIFNLWDGATDLGNIAMAYNSTGIMNMPVHVARRITPTAGSHNYRIAAHAPVAGGIAYGGTGGTGAWNPMFIRVTRV